MKPKYDRETLEFFCNMAMAAAVDRIESGMPTSIGWQERRRVAEDPDPRGLTSHDEGALATAGMNLACIYAQNTDDGMGIGDALDVSGFGQAVREWVSVAWHDKGDLVQKRLREAGAGVPISEAYSNYPDTVAYTKKFVDLIFKVFEDEDAEEESLAAEILRRFIVHLDTPVCELGDETLTDLITEAWSLIGERRPKKSKREPEFRQTVLSVEILSDREYEYDTLHQVADDIVGGDCSGRVTVEATRPVSRKEMAELLNKQGSDPSFLLGED